MQTEEKSAPEAAKTEHEIKPAAREWSNATAAGLVALAGACACFFAMLSGYVQSSALPLIGAWLIAGFVIQLVVALVDLKGGSHTGGNTFLFFSGFFMLAGGIEMLLKYEAIKAGAPLDNRVDGYVWLTLALVMILWTPAFFKPKITLLSVIVVLLDVALPFIALIDLKVLPSVMGHLPAWALLLAGLVGVYLSAAIIVNNAYGKKVYPILDYAPKGKKSKE